MKKEFKIAKKFIKDHKKKDLHSMFYEAYLNCPQAALTANSDVDFDSKREVLEYWLEDDILWQSGYWVDLPEELQYLDRIRDEFGLRSLVGK